MKVKVCTTGTLGRWYEIADPQAPLQVLLNLVVKDGGLPPERAARERLVFRGRLLRPWQTFEQMPVVNGSMLLRVSQP